MLTPLYCFTGLRQARPLQPEDHPRKEGLNDVSVFLTALCTEGLKIAFFLSACVRVGGARPHVLMREKNARDLVVIF